MNDTQTIFTVFYAIFWGTIANAMPKRRPFQWAFVRGHPPIRRRVILSLAVLNVAPVVFFVLVLKWLGGTQASLGAPQILAGVVPAFAVFGLYCVWLGIIELSPERYYYNQLPEDLKPVNRTKESSEPTKDDVHPIPRPWPSIVVGVLCILGSIIVTFLLQLF